MNLLILPGNSPRHKKWAQDARTALLPYFDEVRILEYQHWSTGEEKADIYYEIQQLAGLIDGWDEYAVLAKSVGTVIAALAHSHGVLNAKAYSLLGIPYEGIAGATPDFEAALKELPLTYIFQNDHDPVGSAAFVRDRLELFSPPALHIVETVGDTHDYVDFLAYVRPLLENA